MSVSRLLTSGFGILALVLALFTGPLYHVHPGEGHGPDHQGLGHARVHSHLPSVPTSHQEGPEPASRDGAFEQPSHDGANIELFLSLEGKSTPVLFQAEVFPEVIPVPETSRRRGNYQLDRTHDPPTGPRTSRAPPV